MKKRILITFMLLMLLTLASCDFLNSLGDFKFELLPNDTYELIEYDGDHSNVIIPSQYKDKDVTVIGKRAFSGNLSVESITIPDTVKIIQDSAFFFLMNMKELNLPDSIEYIGNSAFQHTGITSLTIPASLKVINAYAFAYSGIVSLQIPEGVLKIENDAFAACSSLETVELPTTLLFIGTNVFLIDKALESIHIPTSVKHIQISAFNGCENLTIYVPFSSPPATWSSNWDLGANNVVYLE